MNISSHRLEVPRVARIGSISLFLWALLAAVLWRWIFLPSGNPDGVLIAPTVEEHTLSGGSLLACGLFVLGEMSDMHVNMNENFPKNSGNAVKLDNRCCYLQRQVLPVLVTLMSHPGQL
jgi:mannose/fructose/N-acetylgalactosamine-specific phosphotransferase system component IID